MVKEIQIFVSILTLPDNKTIFIPNGPLATGSLINYSTQDTLRIEWIIGIANGDDLDVVYSVLNKMLEEEDSVFSDLAPYIGLTDLADSLVNITVRIWV